MSNDERNPKSRNPWSPICCLGFSEFLVKPTNAGPDREKQKCVRKNRHKHLPARRATPNRGSIDLPFPPQNSLGNCFSWPQRQVLDVTKKRPQWTSAGC